VKILKLAALVALVSALIFSGILVLATENDAMEESNSIAYTEDEGTSQYIKYEGEIDSIEEVNGVTRLIVKNKEEDSEMILPLTEEDLILLNTDTVDFKYEDLHVGQQLAAYYHKEKPVTMIYPPTIPPDILVINGLNEMGEIKVSTFDEQLISLDNELALTIDHETLIVNQEGELLDASTLPGRELVIFYTSTTKSIPAQTTPYKITVLDS
jgi:hypothetical protein